MSVVVAICVARQTQLGIALPMCHAIMQPQALDPDREGGFLFRHMIPRLEWNSSELKSAYVLSSSGWFTRTTQGQA